MIAEEDVAQALGVLVGGTTGWNDEAVAIYLAQLVQLDDRTALMRACTHILQTHTDLARPSLSKILDRYRYEYTLLRQHQPKPLQLDQEVGSRHLKPMSPAEGGYKIAWEAYEQECGRQGKEPNRTLFTGWIGRIGDSRD